MELFLYRFHSDNERTIGALYVKTDGVPKPLFECFILEDEFRTQKIMHETRIRAGIYELELRTEGRIHEKYIERFQDMHKGVLHLKNTPEFTYIYIHCGNDEGDTSGCLLTGKITDGVTVQKSTEAYIRLYKKVTRRLISGYKVTIRIIDKDDHCVINSDR